MKPRKHAELIKAWADGATIECNSIDGWTEMSYPSFFESMEYRIKTRKFENDAYYPVILVSIPSIKSYKAVAYHSFGAFYTTGDDRTHTKENFKWIGDKLDITFPEL